LIDRARAARSSQVVWSRDRRRDWVVEWAELVWSSLLFCVVCLFACWLEWSVREVECAEPLVLSTTCKKYLSFFKKKIGLFYSCHFSSRERCGFSSLSSRVLGGQNYRTLGFRRSCRLLNGFLMLHEFKTLFDDRAPATHAG
jgi:hypothetical protein